MKTEAMMSRLVRIRNDHSTIVAVLAGYVLLRVKDDVVLEMARLYATRKADLPDWVRILANASSVEAVDDAFDDLMADGEL